MKNFNYILFAIMILMTGVAFAQPITKTISLSKLYKGRAAYSKAALNGEVVYVNYNGHYFLFSDGENVRCRGNYAALGTGGKYSTNVVCSDIEKTIIELK